MKKICICTTVSITMNSFVVETAKYLYQECGYDITLICNEDKVFEKALPEYIHFIPVHMERGIDFSGIKSIIQFIRIFRKEKFDMVQYATPNAACYASIAAKICKVPIRLYCQWGIRYVGLSGISRKIFRSLEKLICRNSTEIRSVSPQNRQFAISERLYSAEKSSVIGRGGTIGVDMQQYDIAKRDTWRKMIRLQYDIDDEEIVFGFSGRISVDKGCKELINAFMNIEEKRGRVKLFIIGPMENNCGLEPSLISWVENSPRVIMTGIIEGKEMAKYYSAIDVLVHPTYREGFGMVIQEAGALGIPTITTKVPGASEVMENGISCWLVSPKNSKELEKVMWNILEDSGKIVSVGQAAYERTKKYYNRKVMLENQRKDYIKLMEGN